MTPPENGARPVRWAIVASAAVVGLLHVLGALQVREQVFRGYRSGGDHVIIEVTQAAPAERASSGLNVLVICLVLGLAPMVPTAVSLVAPGVVFPGSDYYDLTWVLIPFAMARATILHAGNSPASAARG